MQLAICLVADLLRLAAALPATAASGCKALRAVKIFRSWHLSLTWRACCSGLATDTIYWYQVGDPNYGFSQTFAFLTGPPVGPTAQIEVLINADPVRPAQPHALALVACEMPLSL